MLTGWRYGFVSLPHRFNPTINFQRLINYTACYAFVLCGWEKQNDMTLLTALEIAGNYPENILIDAQKDPDSENWTSLMYMTRNGGIHKLMLSFDNFPYKSKEEAISKMEEVAQAAIKHVDGERVGHEA
jgi:hypothetical protein